MSDLSRMSRAQLELEIEQLRGQLERFGASCERPSKVEGLSPHEQELEAQNQALREAQAALERSRQRFAALYQSAPVAFCTLDRRGLILELNDAAAALWGRSPEALVGKPLASLVTEGDVPLLWDHFRRCADGARRVCTEVTLAGGGSPRAARVQLLSLPGPAPDAHSGFHTAILDVTAERGAQERLRILGDVGRLLGDAADERTALEAMCGRLVPALGDACVAWLDRPEGGPLCAAAAGGGASLRLAQAISADGVPPALAALAREVPPGAAVVSARAELSEWLFGAPERTAAVAVASLDARHGARGWVALASGSGGQRFGTEDLSVIQQAAERLGQTVHRMRMYQRALQAVRIREDFLAIVSHDMVNAAASIKLNAEALSVDVEPDSQRRYMRRIHASADWIVSVVRKLLDVAALESGVLELDRNAYPVAALLEEAREAMATVADDAGISLSVQAPAGAWVRADSERVLQVFTNLVGNALKHAPPQSEVRLGARPERGQVHFFVQDGGPGIAPEELPRVFDRFWQARRARRAGVGLGLAIVKAIVEAHGGRAWVESAAGAGATFWFSLPSAEPPAVERGQRGGVERRPEDG